MNWQIYGILVFAWLVWMVNTPEHDQLSKDQTTYCEMVQTFKETNGRYGWPDYRGIAAEVCK